MIQIDLEARNVFTFNGQVSGHLVKQGQPATVSERLFYDTVNVHVQTFQHYKLIMTLHSGAYRNKLEVDNTGSIEITISIVLARDFLRSDCLLPGKIDSTPLSFHFRIEFQTPPFSNRHNSL